MQKDTSADLSVVCVATSKNTFPFRLRSLSKIFFFFFYPTPACIILLSLNSKINKINKIYILILSSLVGTFQVNFALFPPPRGVFVIISSLSSLRSLGWKSSQSTLRHFVSVVLTISISLSQLSLIIYVFSMVLINIYYPRLCLPVCVCFFSLSPRP